MGVIALLAALTAYCLVIAWYLAPLIAGWHALAQLPVYILLGVVWLLPLKRFLVWMETGRWTWDEPDKASQRDPEANK